jgi:hypothetical protein
MSFLSQKWGGLKARAARLAGTAPEEVVPELPVNQRHDDLYLVEFPKSGITWLCFLAANVNLLLSGDRERLVTFFNVHGFIPEINVSPCLADPQTRLPGFRMIKSHARFNVDYARVIYLVRDPRHVMPSFHAFLTQLGWYAGSLEQMIEDERFGIGSWCAHVKGWLDKVPPSRSFALFKYEDMLADPGAELKAIYRLLGFDLPDDLVKEAVARASIARMREEEALYNARHPANRGIEFVRKGETGGPRAAPSASVLRRIESEAGELMVRLGYKI